MLAAIEDQQHRPGMQMCKQTGCRVLRTDGQSECGGDGAWNEAIITEGPEIDKEDLSGEVCKLAVSHRTATEVLPIPPGPTTVTKR